MVQVVATIHVINWQTSPLTSFDNIAKFNDIIIGCKDQNAFLIASVRHLPFKLDPNNGLVDKKFDKK